MDREESSPWVRHILAVIDRVRPRDAPPPAHDFQRRFLVGACLLGSFVAVATLPVQLALGVMSGAIFLLVFLLGLVAALAAIRLGVSTRKVAPFTQTILVIFLVAISLTTRELHPEQLAWLIFIPLAALVFHEPRVEDVGTRRNGLRTGILVALGAGAFIVEAHVLGFTLDGVEEPNSWRAFIDFALLIGAVVGLLSLYDLSARETLAELQRLRQLLSMCAWCKKINSSDSWMTADQYLAKAHPRQLSHGICPTCAERHFSE